MGKSTCSWLIQFLACRSLAGDVSPIEDGPDMFQQQLIKGTRPQKPGTNIPSLRRERRRNQEAAHKGLRESSSKDALRDRNYHPVQHPSATWDNALNNHKVDPGYGLTTTVTGPTAYRTGSAAPPTLGQRMRQLAKGKAEPIDARPPWSGAGGRTGRSTVVDPVRDNLNVAPLSLPRKSSKRAGRDGGPIGNGQMSSVSPSGSDTSGSAATTVRRLLPSRSNQKLQDAAKAASQTDLHAQTSVTHSYPSPPQIDILPMPVSHPPESSGKTHGGPTAAPLLSPNMMANTEKAIRRKPPPSAHTNAQAHHSHLSMSSSVYSTQTDQRNSEIPPLATGSLTSPEDPWVQPPSRFSITTCNTTIGGSPRHSAEEDRPPLPTPPQQAASIMNRRRPLPGGDGSRSSSAEPIVISMKSSIPSLRGEAHKHSRPETGDSSGSRPASIISTSKALPPAPPEVESAHDRVANLNARLDNLAHRRGNINRSIKQMTELMPMDNLLASSAVLRKRELEKQKVEGLKSELAEIQREEYDLGLKLHRAYKRLERGQDFEPTTLWVRRVTH